MNLCGVDNLAVRNLQPLHGVWAHTESNKLAKAYVFLYIFADIICVIPSW